MPVRAVGTPELAASGNVEVHGKRSGGSHGGEALSGDFVPVGYDAGTNPLANAGAGSSFDAMAPAVTPFGHSPSEVDPLDGGLPIRQGGGSIAFTPPITEPQTYAMLLAALGVVGFVARHRRGTTVR